MSMGDDELGLPPRCPVCGDTTAADKICVWCKPYVEYVCERCARSRPKPVDIAVPPAPDVTVTDTTSDALAQLMDSVGRDPVVSGLMNALMESEGITGDELPEYRTRQS